MDEKKNRIFRGGRTSCPCPKIKCERHGDCDACVDWHGRKGKLPRCER